MMRLIANNDRSRFIRQRQSLTPVPISTTGNIQYNGVAIIYNGVALQYNGSSIPATAIQYNNVIIQYNGTAIQYN